MFRQFQLIIILFILITASGYTKVLAQDVISGVIYDQSVGGTKAVLPGANIFWAGTTTGTNSKSDGSFSISMPDGFPAQLVISFVGFQSDTIQVTNNEKLKIYLKPSVALQGVVVKGRKDATVISTIKTISSEQLGKKELLKAACCNLSESFETNPSVNVSYTDAITGAKEIQMLGLSGIYSQVMTENIPTIRGLSGTYGLSYVPGPWMESIQITKGSGSVANGFESTSGQINVEYLKPENAEKFLLNGYAASSGNVELNAHRTFNVSENTKSILFVHGENMQTKWDHQEDGFYDHPLVSQANVFNRWSYNDGKKFEGQFGVKALMEKRRSGQTFYDFSKKADSSSGYGVEVETKRIELFSKTGLVFPEKPWKSMGLILSGSLHEQESYFGIKSYEGLQQSFYGSLIYMSIIKTTNHKVKGGLDMRYDFYDERYLDLPYVRTEKIPGAYIEYTLDVKEKFGMVAGSRVDYHNEHGLFYTPRLHLKYNFTPDVILRFSGGRSFRTANVFADNISIMATSRDLNILEKLDPERAWNTGANITGKFRAFYRPGSISVDYYVTSFENQVVVDSYTSDDFIYLYNLSGKSYSKSFQVAFNYEAFKRFDVRLAYKTDDVIVNYNGISMRKPLVAYQRGLINVAYETRKENFRYDFTTHFNGKTKLSVTESGHLHEGHEETQVVNNTSPEFITFNAQVTWIYKSWEVYLGGENLSGFRQDNPVLNPENPFEKGFDATNVWGPVMGRKIYAGFRYTIKNKTN